MKAQSRIIRKEAVGCLLDMKKIILVTVLFLFAFIGSSCSDNIPDPSVQDPAYDDYGGDYLMEAPPEETEGYDEDYKYEDYGD